MASPGGPPSGGGRTILGLKPRTAIIAGVGIVGAALVFFWWRSRSSSSASSTATSASASAGSGATDYGGELSTMQSELEDLLAAEGEEGGSGGGGTTTTAPPTTPPKTTTPAPPKTTTPPKTTAKPKPAMPAAHETKVTATSVTLSWNKVENATSYRVRVTYQGKLVGSPHLVTGTSATISGLAPLRTYTFHVAAIGPGGTSSETNGPAVKTK